MELLIPAIAAVLGLLVGSVVCYFIAYKKGYENRRKEAELAIGSAEAEAKRIVADAVKLAENKKRESLLEAKEEIIKNRAEFEKEVKESKADIARQERRIQQKEETLDKKMDSLEASKEALSKREKELEKQKKENEDLRAKQLDELQNISGFSVSEAKEYLLRSVEDEVRHEKAILINNIENEAKEEADKRAKNIISMAIQRCAADHVAESTVSVVPLPNEEMKGRIIGREGRNIRTLETLTGVDLIIDDTPEAVVLSAFDPIRREIARLSLEKLISDGRIHPARIEETVERSRKEVDAIIKQEGERATFETGVHGLHPEIIKLLGRLKYRTSYGQNVLNHAIEVSNLSGIMAGELGVDIALAKRAGLLHDLGKSVDHEVEGSHVTIGADLARKYKESPEITHAIMAHHGDVPCETVIACIVQACDAISAARPGARRENLENYIKRLQRLEEIALEFDGVEKCYAISAGREIRVMVKPESINDDNTVIIARDIVKQIESELEYPGQIKVSVIRETRSVEYAK